MIEQISVILYVASIVTYLSAFGIFLSRFSSEKDMANYGSYLLILGFVMHTSALVLRFVSAGRIMAFQPYEVLAAIAWFLVLEALIVEYWSGITILGLYVSVIASTMLIIGWSQYNPPATVEGILKNSWVTTHFTLVFISYGAFIIAASSSFIYLVQERQIKGRKSTKLLRFLPSLKTLEDTSFKSISIGFVVLTVALGIGISNAINLWGKWDIYMIIAAIFAWLLYLFYIFAKIKLEWFGKRLAYISIFGLVVILIIHFLIAAYLTNIHIYSGV